MKMTTMTTEKNYLDQILGPLHCTTTWGCRRQPPATEINSSNLGTWNVSLVPADAEKMQMPIFGFAEFIGAMALLAIVYTMSDLRYKFRATVAPIPLKALTFFSSILIGGGTLVSNWWFAEGWLIPNFLNSLPTMQTFLGMVFLLVMSLWVFFTAYRPTKFGHLNCKKYVREVNRIIFHGDRAELIVLAEEIARSAKEIIQMAPTENERLAGLQAAPNFNIKQQLQLFTNDMLNMIASPRMTDAIAASSSLAAIRIFEEATRQKKYDVNLTIFSRNLVESMLANRASLIYIEQRTYEHGFLALMQYFRKAVFGNYHLIERLRVSTPLDARGSLSNPLDGEQLRVYGDCFLLTVDNYLETTSNYPHSTALYRFISHAVENAAATRVHDEKSMGFHNTSHGKFWTVSKILAQMLKKFDDDYGKRSRRPNLENPGFVDNVASQVYELIAAGSYLRGNVDNVWSLHYSTLWNSFFNHQSGPVSLAVQRKVILKMIEEIRTMESRIHYVNSRLFAFAINVAGFNTPRFNRAKSSERHSFAFRRAVQVWTRKHFLLVVARAPNALGELLPPGIIFDAKRGILVRSYVSMLDQKEKTTEFVLQRTVKLAY